MTLRTDFPDRVPGMDGQHQIVRYQDGAPVRFFGALILDPTLVQ
jgi:hypothetical protein